MLATDNNAAECVKVLLNNGFHTDEKDKNGENALCRAIRKGKKYAIVVTHGICTAFMTYDSLLLLAVNIQSLHPLSLGT